MGLLEYNLTHPYPRRKLVLALTIIFALLALIGLTLLNIVTGGYELVPIHRESLTPNDTVPEWWNIPALPSWLRRNPPPCQKKSLERGNRIHLTPTLFEYTITSTWNVNPEQAYILASNRGSIEYKGQSFEGCTIYSVGVDYSEVDLSLVFTVGIWCEGDDKDPLTLYMNTRIPLSYSLANDFVGQYYGYDTAAYTFTEDVADYRNVVLAVLDVLATDADGIISGNHIQVPILGFNTIVYNLSTLAFGNTFITFTNGTRHTIDDASTNLGEVEIYRSALSNLVRAVQYAVELDLGNPSPGNVFTNPSAVNDTFDPNIAPSHIPGSDWVSEPRSFFYGTIIPPYQTWAQMLRAGAAENITLGKEPVRGLPPSSTLATTYLCPSYQRKPLGAFLANVFVGTASMFMSAWAAWIFISAYWAKGQHSECIRCSNSKCPVESVLPQSGDRNLKSNTNLADAGEKRESRNSEMEVEDEKRTSDIV